jgi:hypothetical protein
MKILGGMIWPEDGNNGFLCIVTDKSEAPDKTLEKPREYIEILKEYSDQNIFNIFKEIKESKKLTAVYAPGDTKYRSFIYEYSKWRRENNCGVLLKSPQVSSFEAGVLKIKDYTLKKTIIFPENSMVRSQLMVFSKLSIKNQSDFAAVNSLVQVINSFDKRKTSIPEKEPSIKGWY